MNNKPVYTFRVDYETCKILDKDFASFMDHCLESGVDFEVNVTDANGMGYIPVNMAINLYIKDCRKDKNDRCMANPYSDEYFGTYVKAFIEDFLVYYFRRFETMNDWTNYYQFVVFKGGFTCRVFVPSSYISKDLYDEYLGLGPDYLMGAKGMNTNVLFHYVLPAYYCNLIYDDLYENEEYLKLHEYQVGLA